MKRRHELSGDERNAKGLIVGFLLTLPVWLIGGAIIAILLLIF